MQIAQYGDDGLSPEQLIAAEILATPGRAGMTMEELADHVGTTARTLNRWRRTPDFAEYVKRRTMENVVEHLPEVMATLTEKAKSGSSIKAIEVWLRANGMMQPEMIVRPAAPEIDRSNDAIEREIDDLRRQLEELDELDNNRGGR